MSISPDEIAGLEEYGRMQDYIDKAAAKNDHLATVITDLDWYERKNPGASASITIFADGTCSFNVETNGKTEHVEIAGPYVYDFMRWMFAQMLGAPVRGETHE